MSLRSFYAKFGLILVGAALSCTVAAEQRFALLIGNSKYSDNVGPLKYPSQDVDVLEKSLEKLGFKVRKIKDAGFREINKEIVAHISNVRRDNNSELVLSFIYYAGHGAADGKSKINYLIRLTSQTLPPPFSGANPSISRAPSSTRSVSKRQTRGTL